MTREDFFDDILDVFDPDSGIIRPLPIPKPPPKEIMSTTAVDATQWDEIKSVIPHVYRILLHGPPGTGKTSLGWASDELEPLYIACHEESSVAEFIGHFVPVGDRFVWFDGPALIAWRQGRRLIIDEIDLASGSVLSFLRALLNDPEVARLTIPDPSLSHLSPEALSEIVQKGEGQRTIRPAQGFSVFATMNGTLDDLDEPLTDRFDAVFEVTTPNPEAIDSLPEDLRQDALKTVVQEEGRRIGLRRWKSFAHMREVVDPQVAAKAAFGARAQDMIDALKLKKVAETAVDRNVEFTPAPSPDLIKEGAKTLKGFKVGDRVEFTEEYHGHAFIGTRGHIKRIELREDDPQGGLIVVVSDDGRVIEPAYPRRLKLIDEEREVVEDITSIKIPLKKGILGGRISFSPPHTKPESSKRR